MKKSIILLSILSIVLTACAGSNSNNGDEDIAYLKKRVKMNEIRRSQGSVISDAELEQFRKQRLNDSEEEINKFERKRLEKISNMKPSSWNF